MNGGILGEVNQRNTNKSAELNGILCSSIFINSPVMNFYFLTYYIIYLSIIFMLWPSLHSFYI